ncbi:hypothetical protein FHL15_007495 [Xylaria flabelliformis]|uniref:cellulase n=1 Tax=Xylaria flabelliformis TaxID=2512241 RepID=A0A553HUU2_9PEZI|nr:hypothetical protein FHL15_007495 [Xylaria flabelliformis]
MDGSQYKEAHGVTTNSDVLTTNQWIKTEEYLGTLETKRVPIMALDIVMRIVPATLGSSMARATQKAGFHPIQIAKKETVPWALAARKWLYEYEYRWPPIPVSERRKRSECTGSYCSGKYPVARYRYEGDYDAHGCDFNPYRQGKTHFYGPGKVANTDKEFTVITQFVKDDDGKLAFCASQKKVFKDPDYFNLQGGMEKMSEVLSKGMVLSMSIWHDQDYADMLWLDGTVSPDSSLSQLGVSRGSCSSDSGSPEEVRNSQADDRVVFNNFDSDR